MASMSSVSFIGGPDPAVEIGFSLSAGTGGDGSSNRQCVILAEGVAAGTGGDDEVSGVLATASACQDYFGINSPGAYMAHVLFDSNPFANVRCARVKPLSASAVASEDVVFAGTASSTGEWTIDVGGHLITVPVVNGEAHTVVGARFELLWNARTGADRPPVTATDTAGTVAMDATVMGTLMNSCRLVKVTTGNEPGTMTCTPGAAVLSSGAGTYTLTAIFAALASVKTPLLVSEWDSATEVALIATDVVTKSNPQDQLWSAMVTAESGANASAVSSAVNLYDDERARVIGGINNYSLSMLIAADYAAAISLTNNLALPRNGVVLKHVRVPASGDVTTKAERIAALNAGWCPLKEVDGQMVVTRYIMSRFDLGVVDANAIDILDYTATRFSNRFASLGPLNVVPVGEDIRGEDVITLDGISSIVEDELVHIEEEDGFFYDVKANLGQIVVTYDGGGQVTVSIPASCLKVTPGLHNVLIEGNHKVDNA